MSDTDWLLAAIGVLAMMLVVYIWEWGGEDES